MVRWISWAKAADVGGRPATVVDSASKRRKIAELLNVFYICFDDRCKAGRQWVEGCSAEEPLALSEQVNEAVSDPFNS